MIIIPFLNCYNWEYTLFSDKPKYRPQENGPIFEEFRENISKRFVGILTASQRRRDVPFGPAECIEDGLNHRYGVQ